MLYLSRAGAEQRGGATRAGDGERRWLRRRCCKAEEGARGAGQVCGGAEVRGVPIYRRGMAVARGGRRWPGSAAINGVGAARFTPVMRRYGAERHWRGVNGEWW